MHIYESLTHGTPVYVSALHRFGTDGLLLADFSQPRPGDRAADLCSGCGVVALRWHDQGHRGPCDGVEIDREASALLAQSLENCPEAAAHIRPVQADLRQFTPPERGRYDLAACNPPYFTGGFQSADPRRAAARHENSCTIQDAADCAARLLRDGGKFFLCHRPEHQSRVFCALSAAGLEPKRLRFVKKSPQAAPWLFLCEAQKGRKPGLVILPDLLPGEYPSY